MIIHIVVVVVVCHGALNLCLLLTLLSHTGSKCISILSLERERRQVGEDLMVSLGSIMVMGSIFLQQRSKVGVSLRIEMYECLLHYSSQRKL